MVFGTHVDFGAGFFPRGPYILTEGKSQFVPYGFLSVIISLHSKENVDKRAFLHEVHYSDANRHILHKLDKQAKSLYFVSAFAQSELSKTWLKSGSPVGTDGPHAERGSEVASNICLYFGSLHTLPRYDVQHEVVGFQSLCFSCNAVPVAVLGLRHAVLCFSVLGGSLGFCLQLF